MRVPRGPGTTVRGEPTHHRFSRRRQRVRAMMHGLLGMEGVRICCLSCDNSMGACHRICGTIRKESPTPSLRVGGGPTHADAPQSGATPEAVNRGLRPGETLMTFLDDVYLVTPDPDRVGEYIRPSKSICGCIPASGSMGKTQVWNGAGQASDLKCWIGLLRLQIRGRKFGKVQKCFPISRVGSWEPVWPPRIRRSPVGEHVPQAGHTHSEDSIGPRSASPHGCSGKLFAQSHGNRCSSLPRCTIRDCGTVCANSWESHQTCAMMPRGVLPLSLQYREDWV